ncbi:hypothetical protein ACFQ4L_00485 [Lapidilactobacillus mulanensis]|uniref:Uncharacterized protein n=1 Tax=Lapidilactobacillus mulanensis TaxID=2485999 RepID=A0ABW4DLB8_9LACO|nr:hypothetical protein [Lapidilactobacillus mulanensis]
MKKFVREHLYLLFVVFVILTLGGIYLVKTDAPIIEVGIQQHQFVRHEKNENHQLTSIEKYWEKQLASNFSEDEIRSGAIIVIAAAFILLICQPIIIWLFFGNQTKHPAAKVKRKPLLNRQYGPCRIDKDLDKNFKPY